MSENYEGFLYIPLLPAMGVYLVYLLFSEFLFSYTSSDLSPIGIYGGRRLSIRSPRGIVPDIVGLIISGFLWLFLFIAVFFTPGWFIPKYFFYGILIAISIVQFLALMFNYNWNYISDTGFNYIQKIINPRISESYLQKEQEREQQEVRPLLSVRPVLALRIIYYLLNFLLVIVLISYKRIPG